MSLENSTSLVDAEALSNLLNNVSIGREKRKKKKIRDLQKREKARDLYPRNKIQVSKCKKILKRRNKARENANAALLSMQSQFLKFDKKYLAKRKKRHKKMEKLYADIDLKSWNEFKQEQEIYENLIQKKNKDQKVKPIRTINDKDKEINTDINEIKSILQEQDTYLESIENTLNVEKI